MTRTKQSGPVVRNRADLEKYDEYYVGPVPTRDAISHHLSVRGWLNQSDIASVLDIPESTVEWLTSAAAFVSVTPDGRVVARPDWSCTDEENTIRHAFLRLMTAAGAGAVPPSASAPTTYRLPEGEADTAVAARLKSLSSGHQAMSLSPATFPSPEGRITLMRHFGDGVTVETLALACGVAADVMAWWLVADVAELVSEQGSKAFTTFCRLLRVMKLQPDEPQPKGARPHRPRNFQPERVEVY